jgi:hypothetical protein
MVINKIKTLNPGKKFIKPKLNLSLNQEIIYVKKTHILCTVFWA